MNDPIVDPGVPYIGPVATGGFSPQHLVRIKGSIPSIAYRFNINLQCGAKITPQDDIAIQISVQLLEGYIVLNSLNNGIWDEELQRDNVFIKCAERFEIVILCELNQFKVFINDQHCCDFPQRIHFDKITHLSIDGDVFIKQIFYESSSPTAGEPGLPTPAAPRLTPSVATEFEDEIVDTNSRIAPSREYAHQRPSIDFQSHQGFSPPPNRFNEDPPTYEEALHSQHLKVGASYPTNSFCCSDNTALDPNNTAPYPSNTTLYPTNTTSYSANATPYPLNDPVNPIRPSYPSTPPYPTNDRLGLQSMPLPLNSSNNVVIALNAPGSTAIPIRRDNTVKQCCQVLWIIVFIITLIVTTVLTRKKKETFEFRSDVLDNFSYKLNFDDTFGDDFWNSITRKNSSSFDDDFGNSILSTRKNSSSFDDDFWNSILSTRKNSSSYDDDFWNSILSTRKNSSSFDDDI